MTADHNPAERARRVAIEIRAADLAALYVPTLVDGLDIGTDEEAIGWACHRDDETPRTDAAWAGWLAREIYDDRFGITYEDDQ